MNKRISNAVGLVLGVVTLVSLVIPLASLAQFTGPPAQLPPTTQVTFSTVSNALCTLVAWIFTILIILTVIFILWAAYLYLTADGEEEKIKRANHQLLYAAICLVVAILSRGIPYFVATFLNASTFQGC